MVTFLIERLFGCRHKKLTLPITPTHRPGTKAGRSYVACLECGKQFHYDVDNLCVGAPISASGDIQPTGRRAFQVQY